MNNLVFGDTDIMRKILESTPHIIEEDDEHSCDCEYCEYHPDPVFKCSVCGYRSYEKDSYLMESLNGHTTFKCPHCEEVLITERDLDYLVDMKRAQYRGIKFIIDEQSVMNGEPRCFISKKETNETNN